MNAIERQSNGLLPNRETAEELAILLFVVESLIRLFQNELFSGTVLVAKDEPFEIKKVPSITIHGPTLQENSLRRSFSNFFHRHIQELTFEKGRYPRLYHLDFELVTTTQSERTLIEYLDQASRFFARFPEINLGERGSLPLTVLAPLGSVSRVNLSNLRQANCKFRIEDCPIFDGELETGKLIRDRVFSFEGGATETVTIQPEDESLAANS